MRGGSSRGEISEPERSEREDLMMARAERGRSPRWLGQNFLADPNLLEAIVRESEVGAQDVVLEIGAGEGALSARLAERARHLHAVEIDPRLESQLSPLTGSGNVTVHWGDAMKLDLAALRPAPDAIVSNLPYSVATPLILRTIEELPTVGSWTVMVQREIADRLRAAPGTRSYGAPSVLVQLAAEVRLLRTVDPAVFKPRPRVGSAVIRLRRTGPAATPELRQLVRRAFAHRRKSLARSLELAGPGSLDAARAALHALGLPPDARAERLSPEDFRHLSAKLS
jgi:16S rRNA (adenine1518-N6/adenine1519-N6)-dimethyltransferase